MEVELESQDENEIWQNFKEELLPIKENKNKIKHELNLLRTEVFLFFLFINLAFVSTVFLMQVRFDDHKRFSFNWLHPVIQQQQHQLHCPPRTSGPNRRGRQIFYNIGIIGYWDIRLFRYCDFWILGY